MKWQLRKSAWPRVQEYNFSPRGTVYRREEQRVDVEKVTHLRLTITPNKNGSGTASLTALRLFAEASWTARRYTQLYGPRALQ